MLPRSELVNSRANIESYVCEISSHLIQHQVFAARAALVRCNVAQTCYSRDSAPLARPFDRSSNERCREHKI